MLSLNNIVKIQKHLTEIAKNSMIFGGRLSHEFAIFGKKFCIQYGEANFALAQKYAFTKKSTIFTQSL